MVSTSLRVKNTFITGDDIDCGAAEDGSLSLSRRQFSAPTVSGSSPLRGLESFEENEAGFSLEKAKELPSPDGLQPVQHVPDSEPEGEPHAGSTAPAGAEQKLLAASRPFSQRWADMDDPIKPPCGSGNAPQHPTPKSALASKLLLQKEALRAQMQHRVSFHDRDEVDPEASSSGDGRQDDDLDGPDVYAFCRLVTGGSDYAADGSAAVGSGGSAATALMPASYFAGMQQEAGMHMVPFVVPGGAYPDGQSLAWSGHGLYPIAQQQMGMMMPSQQPMMFMQQQPQPPQTPRQRQRHESPPDNSEARHSSAAQRIAPSTKHSRGRGSLIDIAKREQAIRQRATVSEHVDGHSQPGLAQQPQSGRTINFCPYCRGKVQAHHRFCQFCGSSLSSW